MSVSVYEKGDYKRFGAEFRNLLGALTDPDTVTVKFTKPGGTVLTYTYAATQITRTATGVFHREESLDEVGQWLYSWIGTGQVQEVHNGEFFVSAQGA